MSNHVMSGEQLPDDQCLVCGGRAVEPWLQRDGRSVVRCRDCRFRWVPQGLATDDEGVSVYEGEEPVFLKDGNEAYYLDEANLRSFRPKVRWLERYLSPGARVLDVGAGFGHFLKVVGARFRVAGFDLSPVAVQWSRTNLGVDNFIGSIDDTPEAVGRDFEAITAWDVIEHLPRPDRALEKIRELLGPAGLLFLSTPDAGSLAARLLGRRWHYIDPEQHLAYFGRDNLGRLLGDTGFEPLSWLSFGRHYRVGYIADRMSTLHRSSLVAAPLQAAARVVRPISDVHLYIKLGDVMGVVARRKD